MTDIKEFSGEFTAHTPNKQATKHDNAPAPGAVRGWPVPLVWRATCLGCARRLPSFCKAFAGRVSAVFYLGCGFAAQYGIGFISPFIHSDIP
jgi:hypothetical protein